MKTVENLAKGEMLLVSAKKVNGGKISLEFAQHIDNPNSRPSSIVGLLNADDERFDQPTGGPRRAWVTGSPAMIQEHFGVDCSDLLSVGDYKELNILNPEIKGQKLNIQITETTEGSEYDVQNFETRAKRAGKDGDFITTSKGEYIYVKSAVVAGEAKHYFIEETSRLSAGGDAASEAIKSALGE